MHFARQIFFSRVNLMLALLLIALGSIAYGLAEAPRINSAAAAPGLFAAAVVGMLLGWLLGASRLTGWLGLPIGVVAGATWAILQGGKLTQPLLNWLGKLPALLPQLLRWRETPPNWQPVLTAGQLLADESGRVGERLLRWGEGILYHTPTKDPLSLAVFWIFVLWLLACWAGWVMRRLQNPLLALAPGIGLLAAALNYQGLNHYTLVAAIGAALFLMALSRYHQHENRWLQNRVDFAEDIRIDLVVAAGAIVAALLAIGLFVPSFSVKTITEFIRQQTHPASHSMEESLGLQARPQPTARSYSRPAGLLRSHHLGAGPALTQNVVMFVEVLEPVIHVPLPYESFSEEASAPRYYWRILTYDHYNGSGWSSSPTSNASYTPNQPIFNELPAGQERIRQKVTAVQALGGVLVATGSLQSASNPYQVSWRAKPGNFYTADALGALIADGPYEAISSLPKVSASQLRAAPADYPSWVLQHYLQLPDDLPFRVRELAVEITAEKDTAYDKAKAIESFLRTIPYSLEISAPPRERDVVDYFLFDLQIGFCDYYATSMAVLARAAGLPARVVIGYASGNYDPQRRQYVVVEENYHAWVEIFFNGIGWIEFEPTAIQPTITRDEDRQDDSPAVGLPVPQQQPVISLATRLKGYATLTLVSLLCLGALAVQGLFIVRGIESWWWSRKPPREAIQIVYDRMRRAGQRLAGPVSNGDTPNEFAARLRDLLPTAGQGFPGRKKVEKYLARANGEIGQLTHLYIHAVYSDQPATGDGRSTALRAWRKLRGKLWLAHVLQRGKNQ